MASIRETIGLKAEYFGDASDIEELTRRITELNSKLETTIKHLREKDSKIELGDVDFNKPDDLIPIGNVAEMVSPGAGIKINPKLHLHEIIGKIKKEIESFQPLRSLKKTKLTPLGKT